ncbi:Rieske (2Fe-2S) protein [Streptacidiphilus sp. PB12-B1b]|uniref:Rieske (2Fe-2S) protein n=1 Tax=Streptacidiphilus sp. PB12-B1b TaxID=2705012 RepID=UPI0015FB7CAB|nr:Rieske (2Fe-2S) protein [Streptacidiphilus sp. PB12-B1b]QMU77484.1 Rieske (2Fe-2S) protein [Streptacidiphilus sp. PB12-B1b]
MANDQASASAPRNAHVPARRTVLAGTGIAGAAALLTACGAGGSGSSGSSGGSSGSDGSGAAPAPQGSASQSSSSEGSAAQGLTPTSAIPVGGGKVFTSQQVVVVQPTAGEFKCFTAVCTHQGCIVGSVSDGLITCPCHGSQYHITDGSVARGPAPSPLAAKTITVTGGEISLG